MHELAGPVHDLHLVRLQVADEVPAEGVAVDRVLSLEVLCAVLPDDLHPGLYKSCQPLDGDVLRRDDEGDALTDLFPDAAIADAISAGAATFRLRTRVAISSRAASSSDSRPSSSPLSFRRRSSASTSPTRGDSARPSLASSAPPISICTSRSRVK